MTKNEFEKLMNDFKKSRHAVDELLNNRKKEETTDKNFSFPVGDAKSYENVETYDAKANHDEGNPANFVDAGNLGEQLTTARKDYETRKKEEAKKKDMTNPENWTPEMVSFYHYLVDKCNVAAREGRNYFLCNGTGTPKTFNFVLDYLRDHNNIMYVRESCKGFTNIPDGVYFRLIWG